jgi:hypothetical protein
VGNAFCNVVNRFTVFRIEINMRPEKIGYTILDACVLHNFLTQRAKSSYNTTSSVKMEGLDSGEIISGYRRQLETSEGLQRHGARNVCQEAKQCSLQY